VDEGQSVRTRLANLLAREDYAVELFTSAEVNKEGQVR
jgi:FixJ family two-component response regulator